MSVAVAAPNPEYATRNQPLHSLRVRIYADGADRAGILSLNSHPLVSGMTTNPTLMRKAGIVDYEAFAKDVLSVVRRKPISFEVFSDEPSEMRRQATRIASWGCNVYVKIPITNTRGDSMLGLVKELSRNQVKVNVTAIMSVKQIIAVADALDEHTPAVVSVFAGRIADTGRDPDPIMRAGRCLLEHKANVELLWASVREVFNIFQADACGCHIVTVPHDILAKAQGSAGRDLERVSLDTVKMFGEDARSAGFSL